MTSRSDASVVGNQRCVVTVAICTWNRAALLEKTLDALARVRVPDELEWDVLVVDNNSTDTTSSVLDRFKDRLPLRTAFEPRQGKAFALNRCLAEARGRYVLFTDDDVLVSPVWLTSFVAAAAAYPAACAFGGPIDPWFEQQPPDEYLRAFPLLRIGFCGLNYNLPLGYLPDDAWLWGANWAVDRLGLGGCCFDSELGPSPTTGLLGGEERHLLAQLRARGGSVVWVPDMCVRHFVPLERMKRDYLIRHYKAKGFEEVVLARIEGRAEPRLALWMLRRYCELMGKRWLAQLRASDPVPALEAARDIAKLKGIMHASWRRGRPL